MKRLRVLIADEDRDYLSNLSKYFTNHQYKRIQVITFSDNNILSQYIKNNVEKIDICLVTETFSLDKNEDMNFLLIKLVEELSQKFENANSIFKFQRGEKITEEILKIYSKFHNKDFNIKSDRNSKVLSFISPSGGVGKTFLSIAMANLLSKQDHSVFYLNLESFSSTSYYLHSEKLSGMAELIYSIKEKKKDTLEIIDNIKSIDEETSINFFKPTKTCKEMMELSGEEINRIISVMANSKKYDYIIVDTSFSICGTSQQVIELSDVIYMITREDEISYMKYKMAKEELKLLSQREGKEFFGRLKTVVNMKNTIDLNNDEFDFYIPYIKNIKGVNLKSLLHPNSELEKSIKQILKV